MNATNVTSTSAVLSWNLPANENPENIVYTFETTSSCLNMNLAQREFKGNTILLSGLCSGKLYSFVVQATDITNNVTGALSRAYTFMTADGIPSLPRNVQLEITEKRLIIQWVEPITANGNLTHYEILWSSTNINNCDKAYESCLINSKHCNFTDVHNNKYNYTMDTTFIESIIVCVRAYTSAGHSEWGFYYNGTIKVGAIIAPIAEEGCSGLIAVAVIASLAVVSSVTMGIILVLVIYTMRDTVCDYSNKNSKFMEKTLPPDYNRSASMQSTKSLISRSDK